MNKYLKIFKNKKVLITGHTGFKGSWLSMIFVLLGAKVYGISKDYPTKFYKSLKLSNVKNYIFDLKDIKKTKKTLDFIKPDFIFHLAAQAIVSKSYTYPIETWNSNLFSFLSILDALRFSKKKVNVIMITSDKCYLNVEKKRGYEEHEKLGGFENYSASKASCEILFKSYFHSYFKKKKLVKIVSARAGNVIGGGDWSKDRLIPDIIRGSNSNKIILIRSLSSTRPWQHVLDPLFGYINLAMNLKKNKKINGDSFNIGPHKSKNFSVGKVLKRFALKYRNIKWKLIKKEKFKEQNLLNLNCSKIEKKIGWKNKYNFGLTVDKTIEWYKNYNKKNSRQLTKNQIIEYILSNEK